MHDQRGLLVTGLGAEHPQADLALPALLLRAGERPWPEIVTIQVPRRPTVAFSSRDLRSPGIAQATAIARAAGFAAVVRSPGGRMVAYDSGAVVIDHISRDTDFRQVGKATFAHNAESHARLLRTLGPIDARVGEVDGEYCPGEFSVNVGGRAKVIGSAQRVTGTGSLFSTVVQVAVSPAVRAVIESVSAALGYDLRPATIAGLADYAAVTPEAVADAFAADYRARLGLAQAPLPPEIIDHAQQAALVAPEDLPFRVDDWTRANPLS